LHTRWSFSCHCATILDYYGLIAGESKKYQTLLKIWLANGFPTTSRTLPNSNTQFSILILFSFHWENGSIVNSFYTVAPNSLKPSWYTTTHLELSEDTKSTEWKEWVGRSQHDKQSKTNYFASLIDASILKIPLRKRQGQEKTLAKTYPVNTTKA